MQLPHDLLTQQIDASPHRIKMLVYAKLLWQWHGLENDLGKRYCGDLVYAPVHGLADFDVDGPSRHF